MQGSSLAMQLVVLYGAAFVAGFNENLVNMALLSIMSEYGIDSVTAQWLVTGYMIVATLGVSTMAFFYRRVKLRTLFFAAAAFSFAGSVGALVAQNFLMLLVARLVQAVGTGILIPMMMNSLLVLVPKRKLGTYMSLGSCMITFGPAFAPVVSGAIVTTFGWRYIFVVPTVAIALLSVIAFFFLKNLDNEDAHLDVPSVVLSAITLITLSFGLVQIASDPLVGGVSLAACVACAAIFVVRQMRCEHPLIDFAPMRRVTFWPATLLVVVAMMSSFSMSVLFPQYCEGSLGMTALMAGVAMLIPVLTNVVITLFSGRAFDRFGEWPLLPIGYAIDTVGFVVLALSATALSAVTAVAGTVLVFIGTAISFAPAQTAGLRTLPPEQNAFGVAIMTTFVQIASVIGPSLFTGVMAAGQESAAAGGAGAALASAEGFAAAMIVAGCIAAVGLAGSAAYALSARKRAARS